MNEEAGEEPKSEAVKKAERINKIYKDTIIQLGTEERFVNFLKNYNEHSRESFIKFYAGLKAGWYQYADSRYRYRMSAENRYYVLALKKFKDIFQKKLFNLKCRWVAGEMDLPGIELSVDFDRFSENPASCNIVEPISSKEFEVFMQFMQIDNWIPEFAANESDEIMEDDDDYYSPENTIMFYHDYRSHYHERRKKEIPLWFRFYDKCFGTSFLLDLPHIRTDLEQDYIDIWSNEIYIKTLKPEQIKNFTIMNRELRKLHLENSEARAIFHEKHNRKWEEMKLEREQYIHIYVHDDEIMEELLPLIETDEIIEYYKADRVWRRRDDKSDWIDGDLLYLKEAKEYIPINSHDNYTKAIHKAYKSYERKEILECLPMIFENYLKSIKNNQPFDWTFGETPRVHSDSKRERILEARKWKGEPENIDFLIKENLPANYL